MTEDQAWDDPAPLYRPNWRDRKAREAAATDWQGRALAAEAAAEGYRQRAERAEAERDRLDDARRWWYEACQKAWLDRDWAANIAQAAERELRAALSAPQPADGSAHHPDATDAADGHADTATGECCAGPTCKCKPEIVWRNQP